MVEQHAQRGGEDVSGHVCIPEWAVILYAAIAVACAVLGWVNGASARRWIKRWQDADLDARMHSARLDQLTAATVGSWPASGGRTRLTGCAP